MRRLGLILGGLLAPLFLVACESQTSGTDATVADAASGAEWNNIGFDAKEQRHSPLDQSINRIAVCVHGRGHATILSN